MGSKKKTMMSLMKRNKVNFYTNAIAPNCRSRMNIPFTLKDAALEKAFLQEATEAGLLGLAGHRAVGGMRASLYNAVTLEAVQALTVFMNNFAAARS